MRHVLTGDRSSSSASWRYDFVWLTADKINRQNRLSFMTAGFSRKVRVVFSTPDHLLCWTEVQHYYRLFREKSLFVGLNKRLTIALFLKTWRSIKGQWNEISPIITQYLFAISTAEQQSFLFSIQNESLMNIYTNVHLKKNHTIQAPH